MRIYLPRERRTSVPGVLFFHGGGFTAGDLDTEHGMAVRTACDADCAVVSVDYRLAPEHPFPAALDDGWTALQWMADSAHELGIDATRLAVAGGSAGANLAAATALLARDRGGPALVFQLLVVPVLDHRCDNRCDAQRRRHARHHRRRYRPRVAVVPRRAKSRTFRRTPPQCWPRS